MAKVELSFMMPVSPDEALAMFVRDIVPELHSKGGLVLFRQEPRRLILSAVVRLVDGAPIYLGYARYRTGFLRRTPWGEDHLRVDFAEDPIGTRVDMSGRVIHEIRDALKPLGTPNHWPETANQPHD